MWRNKTDKILVTIEKKMKSKSPLHSLPVSTKTVKKDINTRYTYKISFIVWGWWEIFGRG